MVCFKFFKGCLPQILLGALLNTLSHLFLFLILVSFLINYKKSVALLPLSCNRMSKLLFLLKKLFFLHPFNAPPLSLTFSFDVSANKSFSTNDKNVSMIRMIRMCRSGKKFVVTQVVMQQ